MLYQKHCWERITLFFNQSELMDISYSEFKSFQFSQISLYLNNNIIQVHFLSYFAYKYGANWYHLCTVEMFLLVLCLVSLNVCYSAVDRTREDRAKGADIVQAVIDRIRENCIYPNDRLFLRRLAYVESRDGANLDTFRPNYYGGIWQVRTFYC